MNFILRNDKQPFLFTNDIVEWVQNNRHVNHYLQFIYSLFIIALEQSRSENDSNKYNSIK
jgi:hypothetical protein